MTNNDILDLIRRCNIRDGEELIPATPICSIRSLEDMPTAGFLTNRRN